MATYTIELPDSHDVGLDRLTSVVLEAVEPGASRDCLRGWWSMTYPRLVVAQSHDRLGVKITQSVPSTVEV